MWLIAHWHDAVPFAESDTLPRGTRYRVVFTSTWNTITPHFDGMLGIVRLDHRQPWSGRNHPTHTDRRTGWACTPHTQELVWSNAQEGTHYMIAYKIHHTHTRWVTDHCCNSITPSAVICEVCGGRRDSGDRVNYPHTQKSSQRTCTACTLHHPICLMNVPADMSGDMHACTYVQTQCYQICRFVHKCLSE